MALTREQKELKEKLDRLAGRKKPKITLPNNQLGTWRDIKEYDVITIIFKKNPGTSPFSPPVTFKRKTGRIIEVMYGLEDIKIDLSKIEEISVLSASEVFRMLEDLRIKLSLVLQGCNFSKFLDHHTPSARIQ